MRGNVMLDDCTLEKELEVSKNFLSKGLINVEMK